MKALRNLLDVNEILFLLGLAALFTGVSRIWSLDIALIICGALLILVALMGVLVANHKAKQA